MLTDEEFNAKTKLDLANDAYALARAAYELKDVIYEFHSVFRHSLQHPSWPDELLEELDNLVHWDIKLMEVHKKYSEAKHDTLFEEYLDDDEMIGELCHAWKP
jgi:hypothetical protein